MLRSVLKAVASCSGSISTASIDDSAREGLSADPSVRLRDASLHGLDPAAIAPEHVRAIEPYQIGKSAAELAREIGLPEESILKLASNENPFGMSPAAREAIVSAVSGAMQYPDEFALRKELAQLHGTGVEGVVLGNGSDELIGTIARAYLAPEAESVMSDYAYLAYATATQAVGARRVGVAARDFGPDLDAMIDAITPNTRVVWLANPNNPTGTYLPTAQIKRFLDRVPQHVLVVLDEAYGEFLPEPLRAPSAEWLINHPNLVVAKTFSKIHGMAGVRLGYVLASPRVATLIRSVRQTYSVNHLALAAGRAALADTAFVEHCREHNLRGLVQITEGLRALGLEPLPAHGNFVAFEVPDAPRVHQRMLREGVIVRPLTQYELPDFLRVSVGREEHNARFLAALARALNPTRA